MLSRPVPRDHGDHTFQSLVCTNVEKEIRFEAGSSNAVGEFLTLQGTATTNLLLRSTVPSSQWIIDIAGTAVQTIELVDAEDSDASPGTKVVAMNSIDTGNNTNWSFEVPGATNTWIGAANTTWGDSGNWSLARAPIAADDMTIISNGTYDAILPSDQALNRLLIWSGATLHMNGKNLTLEDKLTCAGALIASGTETVTLKGDVDFSGGTFTNVMTTALLAGAGPQSVTSDGNSFYQLTLTNANRTVTFTDVTVTEYLFNDSASMTFNTNITAKEVRVYGNTGVATQQFAAGSTCDVDDLILLGAAANSIVLRSLSGGSPWYLDVARSEYVRNVDTMDSDARSGLTVYAITSTDSTSNSNWVFDAEWRIWNGSADTAFSNTNNWTPAAELSGNSRVVVNGSYTYPPIISSPVSVRSINIGSSEPSSLKISDTLTIAEDFNIFGNATVTSDVPSTIGGNVTIIDGGTLTHTKNAATEAYKLTLTIAGDMTVDAGGEVNVDEKGYTSAGPGRQGSYGGRGGKTPGPTYGSITSPTHLGSGGYDSNEIGGGAIKLVVTGTTTVEGLMTAKGAPSNDYNQGAGSGGSIWLTTSNLTGNGTIKADGGDYRAGGGGGRVAVTLTGSSDFGNVTIQAYGGDFGSADGGAGTIYKSAPGTEQILIDNSGRITSIGDTLLPPEIGPFTDELESVDLRIVNSGELTLTTNVVLNSMTIDSEDESLDLGDAGDRMTLNAMTINGTTYTSGGTYKTNDWNGYATPPNVTGDGEIQIAAGGMVIVVR